MSYQRFIFDSYEFNADQKQLDLHYSIDDALHFTETYRFNFDFIPDINETALKRAFELLWLMAGVSYYKTYLPPQIIANHVAIDQVIATFLQKTYQKGLGEFFYVNQLDPHMTIPFAANPDTLDAAQVAGLEGSLVGIGGGKDSLVTIELLKDQPQLATWSLDHETQLRPLIDRIGTEHFYVERQWDPQLIELNKQGAHNGHVPISAIIACVGVVVSLLTGKRDHIVSNESSTSEPTLTYRGLPINHQYSKSLEFEEDFQAILGHLFQDGPGYFSFLRPLSEVAIAEQFARIGFDKYHDVFSSCNRAYTHSSTGIFWDGTCPKCAFVFLALTPFVERGKLETLFSGKNLLLDPVLEPTYRQLLGIEGDKPLECVGEIKESRAAMRLAQQKYPELSKYQFELPDDYDYRKPDEHSMPDTYFDLLRSRLG